MTSVTVTADLTVGGTLKDLKHTYPVTVASGKFVVKYLSGQSGTLTTQYNDEDHDNTSSNGVDYSFWLKGAGMYRFDQSDSSNSGNRLKFSTVSDGTHASSGVEWVGTINLGSGHDSYVTGVSYSGTPGSAGAYTEINVQSTPWHDLSPYNTPPLYAYSDANSGMGFGPIRADLTNFHLGGLKYELLNGVGTTWNAITSNLSGGGGGGGSGSGSIVASSTAFDPTEDVDTATMKSIRNYIGTLIDIEPPVFTGGRFLAVGNQGTSITKVVGDTLDPFTYPVTNVTCTDSPTAGPKKGQTISIPLDWRNFEFRSSLTSGANTVVTHATVFDNLTNDPVYVYPHSSYGTLTGSGFNEGQQAMPMGTTLGGWHATFDEPQGMYCKFQMNSDDDHYGRLLNVFMCTSSFAEEMSIELQHTESMQKSSGPGFMFRVVVKDGSNTTLGEERMESATGDLEHGEDYEVYVTWNKMTSADGEGRPRRYDITIAHRKTDGGEWVIDTSPAQQFNYSDGGTTEVNTLAMFSSSSSATNGRTSHYHRRTESALTFGIWNWDGQTSSTAGNGTLKEVKLYNDYISSPSFFDSQHWQSTSTFKATGTRYLRYKATDEAGNETPNTDDHYLTINVNS